MHTTQQAITERRRRVPRKSVVHGERVQELLAFKWQRVREVRDTILAGDPVGAVRLLDELLSMEAEVWAARADQMKALREELEELRASLATKRFQRT